MKESDNAMRAIYPFFYEYLLGSIFLARAGAISISHYLAEYILDMVEYGKACLWISIQSLFLFGDSQGTLCASDSIPLDQIAHYEPFSHIQPLTLIN